MNKHKGRLLLAGLAIAAFVWATSGASEAASRTVTLTVEKVQQMIVDTINSMVPGMIEDAIDARVEELSQAPAGGEEVYPVTNPTILTPVAGTFNVLNFGAKGDGVTEDKTAINNAIIAANAAGGGTVYIPKGTYLVTPTNWYSPDGTAAINMKSNVQVVCDPEAIIQTATNSQTYCSTVGFYQVDNASWTGGQILGDRSTHGVNTEYPKGIHVCDSTNCRLSDIYTARHCGDGLGVTTIDNTRQDTSYSTDIMVERVTAERNGRTGLVVINGVNITLLDCQANYNGRAEDGQAHGTNSGVDLEPNSIATWPNMDYSLCRMVNIQVINLRTAYNADANVTNVNYGKGITAWWGAITSTPVPMPTNLCSVRIVNHVDVGSYNGAYHVSNFNHYTANYDFQYNPAVNFSTPPAGTATVTNMLTNPDFVSNRTGWNGLQASWSAGRLALLAVAQYQNANQPITLISGHKYYHRATLQATNATYTAYSGLNGYYGTYCWLTVANVPTMVSNITTATADATINFIGIGEGRAAGFDTMYTDNCMVVDLTAAYGAGSEPDKATCDAWPFFAGTYEV